MIVDVMGRKEIFKGKWIERKMKQAIENILRNYSILWVGREVSMEEEGEPEIDRQCHVSKSDIQVGLTNIGGPLFNISSES